MVFQMYNIISVTILLGIQTLGEILWQPIENHHEPLTVHYDAAHSEVIILHMYIMLETDVNLVLSKLTWTFLR